MPKKFLVSGLCLSRNLGGPAMALCLVEQLRRRYPDCEFQFAVSATDMEAEREWSARFDLPVVPRDTLLALGRLKLNRFPPWRGLKRLLGRAPHDVAFWQQAHDDYLAAFQWADAVINMEGISYIGDGAWPWILAFDHYTAFHYARRSGRPYSRFVQSFGPFTDWRVRRIARRELSRIPFVPARGRRAAEHCRALVAEAEVLEVPDIAIALAPASDAWGEAWLQEHGLSGGDYTVVSPSSIIVYAVQSVGAAGNAHIDCVSQLVSALQRRGKQILLLPHMYSEVEAQCDRRVCQRVFAALADQQGVSIVEDDLGPREMKWLIGRAEQAVVSRYHALVAAVSMATPVVTLGWNDKYADQLEYYALQDRAIDARSGNAEDIASRILELLDQYQPDDGDSMAAAQIEALKKVDAAFDRLASWIDDVC